MSPGSSSRPKPEILFLEWRPHNRRAECLARDLDAKLFLAPNWLRRKILAPLRYLFLSCRSLWVLWRNHLDVVVVTSPPSLAPLLVYLYTRLAGGRYVVDAHHLATGGHWARIPFGYAFNRFVMNHAAATLVHNECIQQLVGQDGVRAMTLETKIPDLEATDEEAAPSRFDAFEAGSFKVMVPCSFDADEPVEAVYEAARSLPDVGFFMTGDMRRLDGELRARCPGNVVLTGFLSQKEYDRLLRLCDGVLALSTDNYPVRPRAASEAIAAEKPLIASRNPATESHVGEAARLIDNTPEGLVEAMGAIRNDYQQYRERIRALKVKRRYRYEEQLADLVSLLNDIDGLPR